MSFIKKILLLATAVAALAACAKVSPVAPIVPTDSNNNQEVDFQVAKALTTKAGETFTGSVFTGDAFGAFAWQKIDGQYLTDAGGSLKYFMNAQKITKQSDVWKADGKTYYWPKEGKIDFVCYAPYATASWFTLSGSADGKIDKLDASVTAVAADNADLLYSDKSVDCNSSETDQVNDGTNAYNGVPVIFRHALAKVSVQVKGILVNDTKDNVAVITWKEGKLRNVYKAGSLAMELSSDSATDNTKKWTATNSIWTTEDNADNRENFDCALPNSGTVLTKDAQTVLAERFVLPQALSNFNDTEIATGKTDQDFYIKVEVKLYNGDQLTGAGTDDVAVKDGATPYSTATYEKAAKLSTMTGTGYTPYWKMGTKTNYVITVNPFTDEITFDPAVYEWETANPGSTEIKFN